MNQALPAWCCLNTESKMALLELMKRLGMETFDEPQPVWQEWKSLPQQSYIDAYYKYKKIDRFMRQKPHPGPKRVA